VAAASPQGTAARFHPDPARRAGARRRMHTGRGELAVKLFFEPERPGQPALFLQYDIPPGASEGVHTHTREGPEGPWEEFYYVVAGRGRMTLDGRTLDVVAGDHVHVPLGIAHGIENPAQDLDLRILLTAILREA
jgi:mannose-6-phosphate isomerase-like protein (cupin superfamily)